MPDRRSFLKACLASAALGFCPKSFRATPALAFDDGPASASTSGNAAAGVLPSENFVDPAFATGSRAPVGIAIQFYFDVSGSITDSTNEYQAQLDAIASVIENPGFREAIFGVGGPGSAAICIGDFDDNSKLQIGWVDFRENDPKRFEALAHRIRNLRRRSYGYTAHYVALENAGILFDNLPWECDSKYVNILTDGGISSPLVEKTVRTRAILAERHDAVISAFITRTLDPYSDPYGKIAFDVIKAALVTPANTFFRRSGLSYLPGGDAIEIAAELDTQGGNVGRYQERLFQAIRRQIQIRTSRLWLPAPAYDFMHA